MTRANDHKDTYHMPEQSTSLSITKPLILVGMMGVGKTTVGRRLARLLQMEFVDCDQAIEEAAGMSVADIFETLGENEFRSGERRVITRLVTGTPMVIATGGGAFVDDETRALIQDKGISIWLDAEIPVLVERTERRDHRPLLKGQNKTAILTDLLAKRKPFYQQSHIHVESNSGPHTQVVNRIVTALGDYLKNGEQESVA